MSQQTQVSRAAVFYRRWIKRFPTFSSLASAPTGDVLREWSGLGYNNRALRFLQLAKIVVTEMNSHLPEDPETLQRLPGIGRYTAHALACFAFGKKVPVVDVNVRRLLTRWTTRVKSSSEKIDEEKAWMLAEKFLPKRQVYEWNQSLMDLGGMICTARKPACTECPVSSQCRSAFAKTFLTVEKGNKKKEPEWRGMPRRLYRGKILKMLHEHSFTVDEITGELWTKYTQRDVHWVGSLMERMIRDGLLVSRSGKYSIAA